MRLVLIALCFCLPATARAQEPKHRELLEAFQKQLATVAVEAGPSVACVVVSRSEHYPPITSDTPGRLGSFDPQAFLKTDSSPERIKLARALDLANSRSIPDHGFAGGIVIDSAGLILTPYHVVAGATKIHVFLPGGVGSYADIHAADARSDLAVLKLLKPPEKLKAIALADVRIPTQAGDRATVATGKLVVLMAYP